MRVALALATLPLVLAVGAGAAAGDTSLKATLWPKGEGTARVVRTLRCDPPGGSVPRPAAVCRAVTAAGRAAFRPVPPDTACTEIYGGPAVAIVTGRLEGRRVWARFTRENGCQIARWQRLAGLLGPAGPSASRPNGASQAHRGRRRRTSGSTPRRADRARER